MAIALATANTFAFDCAMRSDIVHVTRNRSGRLVCRWVRDPATGALVSVWEPDPAIHRTYPHLMLVR